MDFFTLIPLIALVLFIATPFILGIYVIAKIVLDLIDLVILFFKGVK
jgi:hypothetical protein